MRIDQHISSLLYEHDCVIIPEFGGFIAGYAPARMEPARHLILPPHKNLSFNKHLRSNDGLLTNEIATAEQKTFSQASDIIRSYVSELNGRLQRGEKAAIEKIGILQLDIEKNIQFEPDNSVNYLTGAFGMTRISFLPVKRESVPQRIEKEFRVEKEFVDRKPLPQEKNKIRKISKIPAIMSTVVVLLALGIILLSVKTNIFNQLNYSSLNPFAKKTTAVTPPAPTAVPLAVSPAAASKAPASATPPTPVVASEIHKTSEVNNTSETDKTSVSVTQTRHESGAGFHVVCGCFKIKSNALHFLEKLKSKNLNAEIIGQNKDGLYIVSCGDYKRKEDAYAEMDRVRAQNTDAWMLAQ